MSTVPDAFPPGGAHNPCPCSPCLESGGFAVIPRLAFIAAPVLASAVLVPLTAGSASAIDIGVHTGKAFYYAQDGGTGACNQQHSDSELIAAVPKAIWDANKNGNGLNGVCGEKAIVSYQGKTVVVTIVDFSPSAGPNDIELSYGAFLKLANPSQSPISPVTWVDTWSSKAAPGF